MKTSKLHISVIVIQLLLIAGIVITLNHNNARASDSPPLQPNDISSTTATLAEKISYQGVLEEDGIPVNGNRVMNFDFFTNAACSGVAVYVYNPGSVPVVEGVFSVDIPIGQNYFYGQGVWLRVRVDGQIMGCEEIKPVPYAYSLRPGALIYGVPNGNSGHVFKAEMEGTYATASAILGQTATGFAVRGNSTNGTGLYGATEQGTGVYGFDGGSLANRGYGGVFLSTNGIGLSATSQSDSFYAHGATFSANYGYGVYANSTHNSAIRAIGGNTLDLGSVTQPVGTEGVVGLSGTDTGVWGASRDDSGVTGYSHNDAAVYGSSTNNYGGYFRSTNYRGLYASGDDTYYAGYFTNPGGSNSPGVYINGTLTATGSKSGYVVDIAQNDGALPLETGDTVMITGAAPPVVGEIPVILVRKADAAQLTSIAGVVDQPFAVPDAKATGHETSSESDLLAGESLVHPAADVASETSNTAVAQGEYVSIVTLGAFKSIKVDASFGAIRPGDILVTSSNPGYAMRTDDPRYGAIIGKALGECASGLCSIPVLVTLD